MDNAIGFPNTYPLDSDLSCGERYPTFDQPRPQYSSQIVETQTVSLELSPKFLTLTLHTFVLTQMCPSPSLILSHAYFEALRRLQYPNQHWEGETHTRVTRFLTSITGFSWRHTLNWVPVVGGLFFEALVGHPETNATVTRELEHWHFWATHVNRKWTFCILSQLFYPYFQAIHLYKKKDT